MLNLKKRYLFAFVISAFLLISWVSNAQESTKNNIKEKVYVVRGDKNFPPFEFINSDGQMDGFDVELFKAIMKELGLKYELQLEDFSSVYSGLVHDSIDIGLGVIFNQERAGLFQFGLAYDTLRYNIITDKGVRYKNLEQLRGKKIVVVERMRPYKFLVENGFHEGKEIVVVKNVKKALQMVRDAKVSAMVSYDMMALYYINKHEYKNLSLRYIENTPSFAISLAVPKGDAKLIYMLNLGLQNLKLNGTYDKIYAKWFGLPDVKYEFSDTVYYVLYTVGGLLLLSFIFILLLRYRINKTTKDLCQSNKEMSLAFKAGELNLWFLDEKGVFTIVKYDNSVVKYKIDEIYLMMNLDEVETVKMHISNLLRGTQKLDKMIVQIQKPHTKENLYIEYYVIVDQYKYDNAKRLIGTLKDVTERQLKENQLKEYNVRTDIILDGAKMQQWYYNVGDNTTYYYGKLCYGHLSLPDEKILQVVHDDNKKNITRAFETMRRGEDITISSEYRLFIKEYNEYRYFISRVFPYERDKNGKVTRYIGLTRDNTEWSRVMQEMVDLKEKAETANKLKSAFLANMSHEIRTPLNSIVGFSDLLMETTDPKEQQEYNKLIHMNNELLLKLVNDVLDLSKMEAGLMKMERTEFDISPYFDDLYTNFMPKMREGVQLQYEKQFDSYRVYLDQDRLTQVITNFITNAVKFTEKGFIKFGYKIENEGLKVYVQDTGLGISAENCDRIFERFEKVNSYSQGTGLGLSICKNLVESTGGKIGVDSKLGEGSTFWVWINFNNIRQESQKSTEDISAQEERENVEIKAMAEENKREDTDINPKTKREKKLILIAEDNESNYMFMNSVLGKQYSLARAETGKEAIEECRKLSPDLIIMDVKMPEMDGLTATKIIREFDTKVPIIAATAYAYDSDKQRALAAGCNDYISKPINTDKLFEIIEEYTAV